MRVEEVAKRFDLSMSPLYERRSDYQTERTHWYERCSFWGWAEDGRFATESEDFEPSGTVAVQVYHELADAQESYDQTALGEFEFRVNNEPNAMATKLAGWWDSGMSLEWIRFPKPEPSPPDDPTPPHHDPDISLVVVAQLIRHGNLVVFGHLQDWVPSEDTAEVFALLHDLERALIDDAVEHLTLTTD